MNIFDLLESPGMGRPRDTTGVQSAADQSAASVIGSGTTKREAKKKPVTMMGVPVKEDIDEAAIKSNFKMPPESLQDKMYRQHQELRKQRGAPSPEEYKQRIAQKQAEIDALKEGILDRAIPKMPKPRNPADQVLQTKVNAGGRHLDKKRRQELSPKHKHKDPLAESLRDGEHHTWTVHFADGTSQQVNVPSDEFDVRAYFAKRDKQVVKVDRNYAIQGQQHDAPKRSSDDPAAKADQERKAHIQHDRGMTEQAVAESQVTKVTNYDLWLDKVKALGAEIHPQKDRNVLVAQSWDGEEIGKFHLGKEYGFINRSGELDETIRKINSQYRLLSKKGKNLGTFDTKAGAEKHEREVQYFKHKGMSEATDDPFQQKTDQMQQSLLDRMGKRFGLPPGSTMDQVQAAQQAHLDKNDPAAAAQYKQNMTNIDAGNTAANKPVQLAPKPVDPDTEAGMSAARANKSPTAIMLAQPGIAQNQAMLDTIAKTVGLPAGSTVQQILAADDARHAKGGGKYAKSAAAPVTESTSRATDAKGRTQQEWIRLVKSKFPDAKIIQAKMIDGPTQAILPDGKKLFWKKDEQGIDEELSRRGFLKGLGAAALAGAVGLGSGDADAQNIDLPGPQVSYVAHVSAEANGREVHRSMNLGTRYSSEEEAYADIENSLQEKGITRYNIRIEQKYDMPSYSSDQPSGGTATGRNHGTPGIGDMISGRINREIRAGIPSKGGYATGGTNRGQRERDGSQWWRDRLPQIMREEALEEDIERHLLQMRRAGYDIVQEEWSDKYKDSINCSDPKGFSQKAHCAGKKKNESVAEEKVRLDPKCWTGKKIGNPKTKMKGGVRVNNCVPK